MKVIRDQNIQHQVVQRRVKLMLMRLFQNESNALDHYGSKKHVQKVRLSQSMLAPKDCNDLSPTSRNAFCLPCQVAIGHSVTKFLYCVSLAVFL